MSTTQSKRRNRNPKATTTPGATPSAGAGSTSAPPKEPLVKKKGAPAPKTPAKTPAKTKPATPKQKVAALKVRGEAATAGIIRADADPDDDDYVVAELQVDRAEIGRLAESVVSSTNGVKESNVEKPTTITSFDRTLDRLAVRVQETRSLLAEVARLRGVADTIGDGVDVETDPALADAWQGFADDVGTGDRLRARGWLVDLDARLRMMRTVLTALNAPLQAPLENIPDDLLAAAGDDLPLQVLERTVAHQPNAARLRDLLLAADVPKNVPGLMASAATTGITVSNVLAACARDTAVAKDVYAIVTNSGQPAAWFLTGAGGQRLTDLRYVARQGKPVWTGATIAPGDVHYGDPDEPSLGFAAVAGAAEALPAVGQGLPPLPVGQPDRPRYIGNRYYGNDGGMALPVVRGTGAAIGYVEFDIRPYTGPDRGTERVVVGDDGRRWYTDDHYKTFRQIT